MIYWQRPFLTPLSNLPSNLVPCIYSMVNTLRQDCYSCTTITCVSFVLKVQQSGSLLRNCVRFSLLVLQEVSFGPGEMISQGTLDSLSVLSFFNTPGHEKVNSILQKEWNEGIVTYVFMNRTISRYTPLFVQLWRNNKYYFERILGYSITLN